MLKTLTTLAISAAAIAIMTTSAGAVAFSTTGPNSFSFTATTNISTPVTTTTAFTDVSTLTSQGTNGSFTGVLSPGTTITLTNPTLDFTNAASFDFTNAIGTFTATSVAPLGSPITIGPNTTVSYAVTGSFTVGSDYSNSGTVLSANETFSLTQTGGDSVISISGTFNSPAATLVPEPITISLFGAGLAGIGFGVRRRKKAPAA